MNGLHELPLIIFTVLAQAVVGAFLVMTLVNFQGKAEKQNPKLLFLLVLLGIGFIASIMHLGSPWRAFNSLNRIGESPLSNEIACGALFFTFAGIYWVVSVLNKLSESLAKIWRILTALLGLVFMYMMANLYQINTVPTWHNSFTHWAFYLTVLTAGGALGYALFPQANWAKRAVMFGLFLIAIIVVYQGFNLPSIRSSVQSAVNLVPDYAVLNVIRLCLIAVGIWLLCCASCVSKYAGATVIIFAEMIGRMVFYGMHMTVGTAFAG